MYVFKWANLSNVMLFAADGAGGGSEAAPGPAGGDGGTPGASGGASAPASPSSPDGGGATPPSAAPAAPEAQEFDWSALGSSDDLDYIQTPAETPPVKPAVVPPAKVPTPTPPQAAPQAPQPQVPQQVAPQTPTPTEQAGGTPAPLTASDPMGIAAGLEANRDAIVAHLAQTKFALSEADIKDLDTDVIAAVPKMLARVFLESQVSMQKFLAQAVPGMLQKYNKVTSANEGAEKKFFDTHKGLDRNNPQHRDAVVRMATVYRQSNPQIPLDQLIAEVGPMVMTVLKIGAVAPQPGAPQALPRGGVPFTPAVNGGGGLSPTAEPPNEWAGLGQTYD